MRKIHNGFKTSPNPTADVQLNKSNRARCYPRLNPAPHLCPVSKSRSNLVKNNNLHPAQQPESLALAGIPSKPKTSQSYCVFSPQVLR
jgi:hypothetical protein